MMPMSMQTIKAYHVGRGHVLRERVILLEVVVFVLD